MTRTLWIVTRDNDNNIIDADVSLECVADSRFLSAAARNYFTRMMNEAHESKRLEFAGYTLSQVRVMPLEWTAAQIITAEEAYRDHLRRMVSSPVNAMRAALTAALVAHKPPTKDTV